MTLDELWGWIDVYSQGKNLMGKFTSFNYQPDVEEAEEKITKELTRLYSLEIEEQEKNDEG